MRRQLMSGLMIVGVFAAAAAPLFAAERPAGPPATRPASEARSLKRLLRNLASDDSSVREESHFALMGLRRADLPALRAAVAESLPLEPSQVAALREVVMHVALVGADYEALESGFLGVRVPNPDWPDDQTLLDLGRGVVILSRIPGFCAFRMLQDGDVILSVTIDGTTVPLNSSTELTGTVGKVPAGQTVTFELIRQGEVRRIAITLDRRPAAAPRERAAQGALDTLLGNRYDQARQAWERDFLPLLGDPVG
jgi:hypothetical protein